MLAPNLTSSLLSWYDANGRDLPWRRRGAGPADPWPVLLSEFMLQQTTVSAVIPYFEKWMEKYPSIGDIAAADPEQLLRDWEGLGYYSRARNLHAAAREVVSRYGGAVPHGKRALKNLPGVGEYTAAAVASIAFGERAPALDANNLRVWSRLLATSDRKRVARAFARVLPWNRPGDFNQALMDLGASLCAPVRPRCPECPLSGWCRAFRLGRADQFPGRKPRTGATHIEAAVGIVLERGKVLVQKRPEGGLLGGLWEFPGGKIGEAVKESGSRGVGEKKNRHSKKDPVPTTSGACSAQRVKNTPILYARTLSPEPPERAVIREIREETRLGIRVREKLGVFTHSYTRFRVKLHVFVCEKTGGRLRRPYARWVTLEELEVLPMPSANRRIVRALEKHLDAETRRRGDTEKRQ